MQVVGILVLLAAVWFIQFRPDAEVPYTSDRNPIDTTAIRANDHIAANNPWSKDDGSDEASTVFYPDCAAARRVGAAPIHRGQPGYDAKKDKDGDGMVCETADRS